MQGGTLVSPQLSLLHFSRPTNLPSQPGTPSHIHVARLRSTEQVGPLGADADEFSHQSAAVEGPELPSVGGAHGCVVEAFLAHSGAQERLDPFHQTK